MTSSWLLQIHTALQDAENVTLIKLSQHVVDNIRLEWKRSVVNTVPFPDVSDPATTLFGHAVELDDTVTDFTILTKENDAHQN